MVIFGVSLVVIVIPERVLTVLVSGEVTAPQAVALRGVREAGYEIGARAVHLTDARW